MAFSKLLGPLAVGAVLAFAQVGLAQTVTTIRFADYGPNRGTRAKIVEGFFKEIETETGGRVKIDQHWGGALLGAKNGFRGLQAGVADMATISASYAPQDLFGYRVGDLPITSDNESAQTMALYDLATMNPQIKEEFDKAGVVYIANYTVGPIQMVCKGVQAKSFADLVGKKVRYTADYGKIFADLGVTTISLSTPEIYQAMSTGLVNCAQTYAYTTLSYKLIEVSDQFLVFDLGTLGSNAIFMNKASFDKLDPKDQKIILAAGKRLTENEAKAVRDANQAAIKAFPKAIDGKRLDVLYISDADRMKIEAASQPYIKEWVKEASSYGLDGQQIVDEYVAGIRKNAQ